MPSGLRALRKIQCAREVTHGTAITTSTAQLIGKFTMKQDQKYYRPDDLETGSLSSFEHSHIVSEQMAGVFESDANYEQLGYILAMGVKGGVTPTGPSDSLYTWTFEPNLTAINDVNSYTLKYGDDIQAFISPFCFATDFELSGSLEDAVKVKANIVGQNVRAGTFTSLSNPAALNPVKMGNCKLYINPSWATMGNTQVSNTIIDFAYKVTQGITPVKYGDGSLFFTEMAEKKRHVELDVTFAFTSGVAGYFTDYITSPQAAKFIRLAFQGPLVGSTSRADLNLDGAFIIDDYDTFGERDGQDIVKLKLVSKRDATSGKEWSIILKNALAALP